MYPRDTQYILAQTQQHYDCAHAFLDSERESVSSFTFPTIIAWRGQQITGVMGSQQTKFGYTALPIHCWYGLKNAVPTMLRLFQCYEAILRDLGITSFCVPVPVGKVPCCPSGMRMLKEWRSATLYHVGKHCDWYQVQVPVIEENNNVDRVPSSPN